MSTFLTPPQLAERYGIGLRKVLSWIASGELAAIDLSANRTKRPRWRISTEALERFETARTSRAAEPTKPRFKASKRKYYQ